MLARLTRLPLRRCLHTQAPRPQPTSNFTRLGFTFGASVAAASYLTWHLNSRRIALDSTVKHTDIPQPSKSPDSPPTIVPHVTPFVSDSETTASSSREFQSDTTITDGRPSPMTTPESDAGKVSEAQVDAADEASDAGSGGAYNPVTGEINWDCPCLGGMAHGPCGPEFREAFACFVYSEDEPKGINCVEKFKGMQDCFRAHPDVYADEIMDDEDEEPAHAIPDEVQPASDDATTANISPIPVEPKLEKGKLEEVPSEATPSSQS